MNTDKFFELNMQIAMNPQKFISYERLVKKCIKDTRPYNPIMFTAVVPYPNSQKGLITIFKIDGAYIHKKAAHTYILLAPSMLEAYGKTPKQFLEDWERCHKR